LIVIYLGLLLKVNKAGGGLAGWFAGTVWLSLTACAYFSGLSFTFMFFPFILLISAYILTQILWEL
jgi:hypothetical protein